MSLHDVYRAFRDLYHQVRDSLRQVRTANTQIPGTWPNGTEPNPNNHAAGASSPSRKRLPSPPSTLQSDALQSLPSQYHSQQTHTGGNGPPAVASHLDPGNFWGDLVILPRPPSPFAGQWQASHSLALLVDAIYHWAESTIPPFNEGGLSPQKVGLLLSMGEYANEHNIYALCEQNATIMSFGSRWLKEKLINQGMREFYNLYNLSYNIHNVPPQAQSFFNHSTFSTPPPLLTRQGHLRFVLIGILIDPYTNFVNINKFLSKIPPLINPLTGGNLPSSIPRYAFPATEDSNTKQYVDGIRQRMATMAFAGASVNLQQGGIALDLAGSLHGGGYGSTSTGTRYNGSMIGAAALPVFGILYLFQ